MNRRLFLKLTGLIAAGQALQATPVVQAREWGLAPAAPQRHAAIGAAPPAIQQPGAYRISGLVRLEAPLVEISGIATSQRISWSAAEGAESPVASFVTFEELGRPDMTPDIRVIGGRLEALTVTPILD